MSIDKLAGIYVYCMDYHDGQWSRLYRLMSKISRTLHLNDSAIRIISGNWKNESEYFDWWQARMVYETLEQRKAR